ncbi:hypothetical protein DCCM_4621 [Desulfocucumis palustris]|uniref:Uncharacterized protein n=1 Tax=Desulfocucumis palustris TaxID=1898651 RepID=A0A2L2XH89_9FIRM|nr:hypothetical protein [Desulfocucumis palustris]GBF35492.1 hypothetical protein DCCM_4621 [Desulfocucumis palustris]
MFDINYKLGRTSGGPGDEEAERRKRAVERNFNKAFFTSRTINNLKKYSNIGVPNVNRHLIMKSPNRAAGGSGYKETERWKKATESSISFHLKLETDAIPTKNMLTKPLRSIADLNKNSYVAGQRIKDILYAVDPIYPIKERVMINKINEINKNKLGFSNKAIIAEQKNKSISAHIKKLLEKVAFSSEDLIGSSEDLIDGIGSTAEILSDAMPINIHEANRLTYIAKRAGYLGIGLRILEVGNILRNKKGKERNLELARLLVTTAGSGIGSTLGMLGGAFVGGPAGGAVGNFIGGFVGDELSGWAFDKFIELTQNTGDRFHNSLQTGKMAAARYKNNILEQNLPNNSYANPASLMTQKAIRPLRTINDLNADVYIYKRDLFNSFNKNNRYKNFQLETIKGMSRRKSNIKDIELMLPPMDGISGGLTNKYNNNNPRINQKVSVNVTVNSQADAAGLGDEIALKIAREFRKAYQNRSGGLGPAYA